MRMSVAEWHRDELVALRPQAAFLGLGDALELTTPLCLSFAICVTWTLMLPLCKAMKGEAVLSVPQVKTGGIQ